MSIAQNICLSKSEMYLVVTVNKKEIVNLLFTFFFSFFLLGLIRRIRFGHMYLEYTKNMLNFFDSYTIPALYY